MNVLQWSDHGGLGAIAPPTLAKIVLEISLKLMRRQVLGGGSSKSSEKWRASRKNVHLCSPQLL